MTRTRQTSLALFPGYVSRRNGAKNMRSAKGEHDVSTSLAESVTADCGSRDADYCEETKAQIVIRIPRVLR